MNKSTNQNWGDTATLKRRLMMNKYLLFICLSIFLSVCDKDNSKSVNPIDNENNKADLVQVDVALPYPGGHSLEIRFNDKSFFFIYYYDLVHFAPIEYNNHFITYLRQGDHTVSISKFNYKDLPDSSITYSQNFTLGDAEKYRLYFDFEDEFKVIINEVL